MQKPTFQIHKQLASKAIQQSKPGFNSQVKQSRTDQESQKQAQNTQKTPLEYLDELEQVEVQKDQKKRFSQGWDGPSPIEKVLEYDDQAKKFIPKPSNNRAQQQRQKQNLQRRRQQSGTYKTSSQSLFNKLDPESVGLVDKQTDQQVNEFHREQKKQFYSSVSDKTKKLQEDIADQSLKGETTDFLDEYYQENFDEKEDKPTTPFQMVRAQKSKVIYDILNGGKQILEKIEEHQEEIDEMLLKVLSDRIEQGIEVNEEKATLEGLNVLYDHLKFVYEQKQATPASRLLQECFEILDPKLPQPHDDRIQLLKNKLLNTFYGYKKDIPRDIFQLAQIIGSYNQEREREIKLQQNQSWGQYSSYNPSAAPTQVQTALEIPQVEKGDFIAEIQEILDNSHLKEKHYRSKYQESEEMISILQGNLEKKDLGINELQDENTKHMLSIQFEDYKIELKNQLRLHEKKKEMYKVSIQKHRFGLKRLRQVLDIAEDVN